MDAAQCARYGISKPRQQPDPYKVRRKVEDMKDALGLPSVELPPPPTPSRGVRPRTPGRAHTSSKSHGEGTFIKLAKKVNVMLRRAFGRKT